MTPTVTHERLADLEHAYAMALARIYHLETRLTDARRCVGLLVRKAGGHVELTSADLLVFDERTELTTWHDPATGHHVMEVR